MHFVVKLAAMQPLEVRSAVNSKQHSFAIQDKGCDAVAQRCFDDQWITIGPVMTIALLKLRSLGVSDFAVLEGRQASAGFDWPPNACRGSGSGASPSDLPGGLPTGSAMDIDTAKSEFKAAWEALKARTTPEQLAAAYRAMTSGTRTDVLGVLPLFADATRDAVGVRGKLQSPFDQPGDRVARQVRMLFPDGFCLLLPSMPLCRPRHGGPCEVACLLQCGRLVMSVHVKSNQRSTRGSLLGRSRWCQMCGHDCKAYRKRGAPL